MTVDRAPGRGFGQAPAPASGGPAAVRPRRHQPGAARRTAVVEGVAATQATVSRDLEDLGAIKVRVPGGETVYAIPELPQRAAGPRGPPPPGVERLGGGGRPLGQPGRAAHAARLGPRRGLRARPGGPARRPRHGGRRRHAGRGRRRGGRAASAAGPAAGRAGRARSTNSTNEKEATKWRSEWSSPTAAASTRRWPCGG